MHDEIFHFEIFKNFMKYFMKLLIFNIKWLKTFKNMIKVYQVSGRYIMVFMHNNKYLPLTGLLILLQWTILLNSEIKLNVEIFILIFYNFFKKFKVKLKVKSKTSKKGISFVFTLVFTALLFNSQLNSAVSNSTIKQQIEVLVRLMSVVNLSIIIWFQIPLWSQKMVASCRYVFKTNTVETAFSRSNFDERLTATYKLQHKQQKNVR